MTNKNCQQGHTNLHNLCCLWIEMKHVMHFVGNKADKCVQNFIAHDLEANDVILVIHKYRRSSESMWPQLYENCEWERSGTQQG